MPPRLDLTPEQRLEREAARREQSRVGMARLRAERKAEKAALANAFANASTPLANAAPSSTHAGTSRSPEVSPTERQEITPQSDLERIRLTLAPFANRGYVHDLALWARLAETYPDVDLLLQAYGIADWLDGPKGTGRRCSKAFLANWVKRAAERPLMAAAAPTPTPRRKPVGTQILEALGYAAG